jgi:BirA family biotin operon repressor/biotin-[acetyl-CoA-carboxylase] ligase
MELARRNVPEGTLVVAELQTQGKGRLGRPWLSPPYLNLTFSLVLYPTVSSSDLTRLTLASANALVEGIEEATGLHVGVKWPNDILLGGKKVAGLLLELVAGPQGKANLILGIGLNVNILSDEWPEEIRSGATSLREVLGSALDRERLLAFLLKHLERWYNLFLEGRHGLILSRWKELSETLGEEVRVMLPQGYVEGRALDLTEEGALILDLGNGERRIVFSGDVVHVRVVEEKV